jgi:hypothetical protein
MELRSRNCKDQLRLDDRLPISSGADFIQVNLQLMGICGKPLLGLLCFRADTLNHQPEFL